MESVSFWSSYLLWRDAVVVAVLAGVLCAYLGVFIVLKRMVFVSAALSSISSVGVAVAFLLASVFGVAPHDPPLLLSPRLYALGFAALGAIIFSFNLGHRRISGESAIGLGYIIASALVIVVLNSPRVAQEAHEINDLLYGNAVAQSTAMVWWTAATFVVVLMAHALFRKEFVFVSFDLEMARTLGYRTRLWNIGLFLTFAIAVSVTTQAIGALPVFAFMVVPPAAALLMASRLWSVFALATGIAVFAAAFGYYLSFVWSLPTGATMVVVAAATMIPGLVRLALLRRK
ncbi:MAG TPA: metal ABC transporter permease [Polyangia bacterium]|nr:metal ABC transporter permease [Polyangia bacterium]